MFPGTRHSLIADMTSDDAPRRERAWQAIVEAYWKPIYKYVRLRWRRDVDDAEDLVQGFFARAIEKDFFATFDPSKARFRTFVRTCVDGYAANEAKARAAQKRGGGRAPLALDFIGAESELTHIDPPAPDDMDSFFNDEWMRSIFDRALETVRCAYAAKGHPERFRAFERYELEDDESARPSYDEIGRELGVPATTITNWLFAVRRDFRTAVMDILRSLTSNDEEFRDEVRALLGDDPT